MSYWTIKPGIRVRYRELEGNTSGVLDGAAGTVKEQDLDTGGWFVKWDGKRLNSVPWTEACLVRSR